MKTPEVREALFSRYPTSEYLSIDEAPEDSMRQGRKLDRLVVSLWRSRGLELDGIEIKVDLGDWRKELKEPAKADWWYRHVHRFWIAAPEALCDKIKEDLPSSWGLLSVTPEKVKVARKAPKHDPEPLDWSALVGCLRAAADAGPNALIREFDKGVKVGYDRAERELPMKHDPQAWRVKYESLNKAVEAFQQAADIHLGTTSERYAAEIGQQVKVATAIFRTPKYGDAPASLRSIAETLTKAADDMEALKQED